MHYNNSSLIYQSKMIDEMSDEIKLSYGSESMFQTPSGIFLLNHLIDASEALREALHPKGSNEDKGSFKVWNMISHKTSKPSINQIIEED